MKALRVVSMAAMLCASFYIVGCEVSHTESDKQGMLGGNKHEETTVTKNPVTGDTSVQHSETKTP
jgi:hypothetical protein